MKKTQEVMDAEMEECMAKTKKLLNKYDIKFFIVASHRDGNKTALNVDSTGHELFTMFAASMYEDMVNQDGGFKIVEVIKDATAMVEKQYLIREKGGFIGLLAKIFL